MWSNYRWGSTLREKFRYTHWHLYWMHRQLRPWVQPNQSSVFLRGVESVDQNTPRAGSFMNVRRSLFDIWAIACALLIFSGRLEASTGSLAGTITTSCDGSPVANATVTLTNPTTSTTETTKTNMAGSYTFEAIEPAQQYDVTVTAPGFQPIDQGWSVGAGTRTTVNIALWSATSVCVVLDPPQPIPGISSTISIQVPFGWYGRVHFGTNNGGDHLPWDYTFTPQDAARKSFSAIFSTPGPTALVVSSLAGLASSVPAISGSANFTVLPTPGASPLQAVALNPGIVTDGSAPLPLIVSDVQAAPLPLYGDAPTGDPSWTCGGSAIAVGPVCVEFNRGINIAQQQLNGEPVPVPTLNLVSPSFSFPIYETGWQPFMVGDNAWTYCPYYFVDTTLCRPMANAIIFDVTVQAWVPSDAGGFGTPFGTPFDGTFSGQWTALPQPGAQGASYDQSTTLPVSFWTEYPTMYDAYLWNLTISSPVLPIVVHQVDTFLRIGVQVSFDLANRRGIAIYPPVGLVVQPGTNPTNTSPISCTETSAQTCFDTTGPKQWIYGPPFLVHIQPTAMTQQQLQPFLLVYQPPGDSSGQSVSFGTSTSTTIEFSLGFGSSTAVGNSHSVSDQLSGSAGSSSDYGNYSVTVGIRSGWSTQSSSTTSTSNTSTVGESQSFLSNQTFPIAIAGSVFPPDPTSPRYTFFDEPFWQDTFFLLLNPKFSLWNLSTCADSSLPPCAGPAASLTAAQMIGADPQYASATVEDFYKCMAPGGAPGGNLTLGVYVLTPQECYELAKLDQFFTGPFLNAPYNIPPSAGQSTLWNLNQFTQVAPYLFGFGIDPNDPSSDRPFYLNQQTTTDTTYQNAQTSAYQATTAVALTNCLSVGTSASSPFGFVGASGSFTDCHGHSNSTGMSITNSQTMTSASGTTINVNGELNDTRSIFFNAFNSLLPNNSAAPTYTTIWLDSVNDDWAFAQPNLPLGPATASLPPPVVSSVTSVPDGGGELNIIGTNFFDAVAVSFGSPIFWGNVQMWNPAPTPYSISEDGTKITILEPPPRPPWLSTATGNVTVDVIVVTPSGISLPNEGDQYTYSANEPAPPHPLDHRLGIRTACVYKGAERQPSVKEELIIRGWGFLRANSVHVGSVKYPRILKGDYYRKRGFVAVNDSELVVSSTGIVGDSKTTVTVSTPLLHVSAVAHESKTCRTDY
jgi:hypothetical protein